MDRTESPRKVDRGPTGGNHRPPVTWRLPILLAGVIVVMAVGAMLLRRSSGPRAADSSTRPPTMIGRQTVSLRIVRGDGTENYFPALPWTAGMTVAQALDRAGVRTTHQGEGPQALLTSIEGQKNEGSGERARNWIYRVNGRLADKSYAAYRLRPGDAVLWTFAR